MNNIKIEELDKILHNIYVLEKFDDYNTEMSPENAKTETKYDIIREIKPYNLQTIIIAEDWDMHHGMSIWQYLCEDDDFWRIFARFDGEFIYTEHY